MLQASIVATGRDMRSRIETLDRGMSEYIDRRNRQTQQALEAMTQRIESIAQSIEHPQRAARASRVAFAPRSNVRSSSVAQMPHEAPPSHTEEPSFSPAASVQRQRRPSDAQMSMMSYNTSQLSNSDI